MAIPVYPSDVNDAEWALLAPLIPTSKPWGCPRSSDMRRITNGVFYVLRSGCAWRYLPREYGAWQTVYYYFRQWRRDGTWIQIHAHLRELARLSRGNPASSRSPGSSLERMAFQTHDQGGGTHGTDSSDRRLLLTYRMGAMLHVVNLRSSRIPLFPGERGPG